MDLARLQFARHEVCLRRVHVARTPRTVHLQVLARRSMAGGTSSDGAVDELAPSASASPSTIASPTGAQVQTVDLRLLEHTGRIFLDRLDGDTFQLSDVLTCERTVVKKDLS